MTLLDARFDRCRVVLLATALVLVGGVAAWAGDKPQGSLPEATGSALPVWPSSLAATMARIPIQDAGRVKPLGTWAHFTMMQIGGKSYCKSRPAPGEEEGEKRTSIEWVLDSMFHPVLARTHTVFLVDDQAVLRALGMDQQAKKRRARYSYEELGPILPRLHLEGGRIADQLRRKVRKFDQLSHVEKGLYSLWNNVTIFEGLTTMFDFVDKEVTVPEPLRRGVLAGKETIAVPELRAGLRDAMVAHRDALAEEMRAAKNEAERDAVLDKAETPLRELMTSLGKAMGGSRLLAWLPPTVPAEAQADWFTLADTADLEIAMTGMVSGSLVDHLVAAGRSSHEPADVEPHLTVFQREAAQIADERGQYQRVGLEVEFYRFRPFLWALMVYVTGFVFLALTWVWPNARWLYGTAVAFVVVALGLHVYGIVIRSVIRGRPPVLTLYDTILFIGACGVLASLVIERINRQRVAIVLAFVLGALSLWVAGQYEAMKKEDTMGVLVAVLRHNFWLSTHVTTVTLGYAAGLLAAALAHVHVFGRIFGFKKDQPGFYRSLSKMIYGTICFGLLFSVVGTILGGVWAADSWGRFWGWDPKENGALIIVLFELAILHARMGGYIKQHGIALAAVALGPIVAFSWWYVNNMGIGLHSYGHTAGILTVLRWFFIFEAAVLAAGITWWLQQRSVSKAA